MMFKATFILSTGRCGTQWLHAFLSLHLQARVTHEPLQNSYGVGPGQEPIPAEIRIIHLTRHPVETAYSWLSHGAFIPPFLPHQKEKILIYPRDEQALFPEYQSVWDRLTPYEKCLYYWLEVHAHAQKWKDELKVPWLRISSEEIFKGQGLDRLTLFLGHGPEPLPGELVPARIDRHHSLAMSWSEPELICRHPAVLEMAGHLGYDPLKIHRTKILKRYYGLASAPRSHAHSPREESSLGIKAIDKK